MEKMIEAPKMIYASIAAIMGEIGAIGKNKRNEQQKFMYRGIDDVMNTLNPLFAKHQVFVVPEVLDKSREERTTRNGGNLIYTTLTVRYTFYAADGSFITAQVVGEGMDSADKSTNKAMAVAMKYAMFQVFCIPTEEMVDPDSETPPESVKKREVKPEAAKVDQKPEVVKPMTRNDMINSVIEKRGVTPEVFNAAASAVLDAPLDTYHGDLFKEALHRINDALKGAAA